MSTLPQVLKTLPEEKKRHLARLTNGLDERALLWVSGYAAGLAAQFQPAPTPAAATRVAQYKSAPQLTVLYGTGSGNARQAAEGFAAVL